MAMIVTTFIKKRVATILSDVESVSYPRMVGCAEYGEFFRVPRKSVDSNGVRLLADRCASAIRYASQTIRLDTEDVDVLLNEFGFRGRKWVSFAWKTRGMKII